MEGEMILYQKDHELVNDLVNQGVIDVEGNPVMRLEMWLNKNMLIEFQILICN